MGRHHCVIVLLCLQFCFGFSNSRSVKNNITPVINSTKQLTNNIIANLKETYKAYEKEIFQNGNSKSNNQSERSFIWIKTKFNSPRRMQNEYEYKPYRGPYEASNMVDSEVHQLDSRPFFSPNANYDGVLCKIPNYRAREEKFRSKCRNQIPNNKNEDPQKMLEKDTEKILVAEQTKQNMFPPFSYDKKPHYSTSLVRYKSKELRNPYNLRRSAYVTNDVAPQYLQPPIILPVPKNVYQNSNNKRYNNPNIIDPNVLSDADKLLEYIKETLAGNYVKDSNGKPKCADCKKNKNGLRKTDFNRKSKMKKNNEDKRRGRGKNKKNQRLKPIINVHNYEQVSNNDNNKTGLDYDYPTSEDDKSYIEDIVRTNNEINNIVH